MRSFGPCSTIVVGHISLTEPRVINKQYPRACLSLFLAHACKTQHNMFGYKVNTLAHQRERTCIPTRVHAYSNT